MTPEQFAYWLQGFAEINGTAPTQEQWIVIQDHLKAVFNKVTPNRAASPVAPIDPLKQWKNDPANVIGRRPLEWPQPNDLKPPTIIC